MAWGDPVAGARRIVGNTRAKEGAHALYHVRVPRSTTDLSSRQRCLDLLAPLGIRTRDRRMVLPISEAERKYHWSLGPRPDDHPGLSDLGL